MPENKTFVPGGRNMVMRLPAFCLKTTPKDVSFRKTILQNGTSFYVCYLRKFRFRHCLVSLWRSPSFIHTDKTACPPCQRIRKENLLIFFRATPVPKATACNGSSAILNSILILSVKRFARPLSSAPPPAR